MRHRRDWIKIKPRGKARPVPPHVGRRASGASSCRRPLMSTQRTAWALGVLVTVCGTTQAEDARVIAKLDQLGAFVRRDESKPGKPIVSVEVLGILERRMTDADLKELAPLGDLRTLSL